MPVILLLINLPLRDDFILNFAVHLNYSQYIPAFFITDYFTKYLLLVHSVKIKEIFLSRLNFSWENYSACGRPMSDAPFVAFKVPLSKVGLI